MEGDNPSDDGAGRVAIAQPADRQPERLLVGVEVLRCAPQGKRRRILRRHAAAIAEQRDGSLHWCIVRQVVGASEARRALARGHVWQDEVEEVAGARRGSLVSELPRPCRGHGDSNGSCAGFGVRMGHLCRPYGLFRGGVQVIRIIRADGRDAHGRAVAERALPAKQASSNGLPRLTETDAREDPMMAGP
jgi:hypothetical protein